MMGTMLSGYRVMEQIGAGGMATVYKAYDASTDRYVALKILPEHYSHNPQFRERFNREAKAIARLEHPHILPIHAYGEENGIAYLVMRYVETGTLSERLLERRLSLDEAVRLVQQIAAALDYAHEHGVLHRDVKPSNILLDKVGNAYLTDFGIAKIVEATMDLTGGGILGTPKYMSPEQCQGGQDLTPASDQYALGIVLYEIVTGRVPFDAETPMAVIYKHLHDPMPLPRSVKPDLPESVERVLLKALAKEPPDRYPTCKALADAFQQAASESKTQLSMPTTALDPALLNEEPQTIPYTPPQTTPSLPKRAKRGGALWLVGGLIGLVVLAVIGAVIFGPRLIGAVPAPTSTSPAPNSTSGPEVVELTANLAYGKPVTASAFLPDETPEMAVDENEGTRWGAGAPAPQWIEIDLQGTFRITEIRLLVDQYPAGPTIHRIQVQSPSGGYTVVHEFNGTTNVNDWLIFTPPTPLENIRTIRIETVSSPSWVSWKEIRVSGETEPSAESLTHVRYGWEFNTGYPEGWGDVNTSGLDAFVVNNDGWLTMHSTNADPYFFSPPDLNINASTDTQIEVRMRISPASDTSACIYFITDSHGEFNESKILCVNYPADKPRSFVSLIFDMSSLNTWKGTVRQLRFDPPEIADTDIEIDYVRVLSK